MEERSLVYRQLVSHWAHLAPILKKPENDSELEKYIELSDFLMDDATNDSNLETRLELVGTLISEHEQNHIEEPEGTAIDAIRFFMEQNGLRQKDLVELESPGVVPEILNGKRELNRRQIKALAKLFKCSQAVFI
ncbi:transcriptional regulator [bacterium]|nr:transcriptional regulator [bacterium]